MYTENINIEGKTWEMKTIKINEPGKGANLGEKVKQKSFASRADLYTLQEMTM